MISYCETCPVCGQTGIEFVSRKGTDTLPFGEPFEYDEEISTCLNCKESGDFSGANDKKYLEARKMAEAKSIQTMIDVLVNKHGFSHSYLERALELPFGILNTWRNHSYPKNAVALLRILATYPWIVAVADESFSKIIAENEILLQAERIKNDRNQN